MGRLESVFDDFEGLFAGVPAPKHPLDSEQAAPFTTPTTAEVEAMRAGVEEAKRRNREASPFRAWQPIGDQEI